jgi:hypothetical protein
MTLEQRDKLERRKEEKKRLLKQKEKVLRKQRQNQTVDNEQKGFVQKSE